MIDYIRLVYWIIIHLLALYLYLLDHHLWVITHNRDIVLADGMGFARPQKSKSLTLLLGLAIKSAWHHISFHTFS